MALVIASVLKHCTNDQIMRRTFLLLLLVIVSLLLCVQCNKHCNSEQLDDLYFTAKELAVVPYQGTETLVFKNSNGDSICFTGQGRTSHMDARVSNTEPEDDECFGDTRNAEDNAVVFKSGNTDSIISVHLYFPHPFANYEALKTISFHYGYKATYNVDLFHGTYGFFGDSIANAYPYNTYFYYVDYFISGYYSSLTLVNKTYTRVYELMYYNGQGKVLYYNVTQGIVGYKESSGIIWYLDSVY